MQVISEELARLRREDAMAAAGRWRLARASRRDRRFDQLRVLPLFAGLTTRQLATVARHADPFTRPAGAVLTDEGTHTSQLVVVASGVAEATIDGARTGILAAGDHFGERTLLGGPPPLVPTVTALTDLSGFAFSSRGFWSVVHAVPAIAMRLAVRLAEDRYAGLNAPVAAPQVHESRSMASTP